MRKILAGLALALSLAGCAMPAQSSGAAGTGKAPASADQEPAENGMKAASADDMPGVVLDRIGDDEGLTILPIEDADPYNRKATKAQIRACVQNARYPRCLP